MSFKDNWMPILAIPLILIFAYADKQFIGETSLIGYIIICAFEYAIFACGIYYGREVEKRKRGK